MSSPLRIVAAFLALLVACASPLRAEQVGSPHQDAPRLAATLDPAAYHAEALLVVHYHRPDGAYDAWNLWSWPEGGDGTAAPFAGQDAFGRYAIAPFAKAGGRAGFLIRQGNWEAKDFDQDRFVPLAKGVTEIWIVSGEEAVRTDPTAIDLRLRIVGAFLDARDRITLATSAPLSERQRDGIALAMRGGAKGPTVRRVLPDGTSGGKQLFSIELAKEVRRDEVGRLEIRFDPALFDDAPARPVIARDVLDAKEFAAPNAALGARCTATSTTFTTWSPVADAVELVLFDRRDPNVLPRVVPLTAGERGLWSTEVKDDLHGVPYRYRYTCYGVTREVPDIHGFAANADSSRTVVVDLARLEPAGFASVKAPTIARPTDEILYEVHVRDYSIADERGPPAWRGTYLGLTHANPREGNRPSSGISHLTDLGVTAVHLLPVHDFSARPDEYNWGYWTTLFNVPETNYASDRNDPTSAIVELRSAVTALHQAGLRVVLDVVYNHTSDAGPNSPFDAAVPGYFFRTTRDGRLVNDTGVGNTIADERPMMRKYIVDSLRHWLRDYRVDGFRFDLLGSHEPATVKAICEALRAERPDITLYGEPWTGGGQIRFGKGAQKGLPIAVFNDHLRNAIRGDLDGDAIGFATGAGGDDGAIRRGVVGAIDDFTQEPGESVNYASAHDNLSLWDKIAKTQPSASDADRRSMQKLAMGIVLTSQGVAFLHGGCDFCRTKQGRHNTFDAGDAINQFDWNRKAEYRDVQEFVAGLVHLRRAHPAFRMDDDAMVRKAVRFLERGRTVAFTIDGGPSGDAWKRILVAYNDEPTELTIELPQGAWQVVVDATKAGVETIRTARGTVTLPAYSMVVARE